MLSLKAIHKLGHDETKFELNVNFEIPSNGVTALFGPSGSGKSTLLKIISGLIKANFVYIKINKSIICDTSNGIWTPPYKRRIGYVFQDTRLFPHLSVKENLKFGMKFNPISDDPYLSFEKIIETFNLSKLLNRNIFGLSGGEKQLVAIGRALLANPKLLLLDEPLANLDLERKEYILPYLQNLYSEISIPTLYVSHSLDEIRKIANSMLIMDNGITNSFGTVEEVTGSLDLSLLSEGKSTSTIISAKVLEHDDKHDLSILNSGKHNFTVKKIEQKIGTKVRLQIHPKDVAISKVKPEKVSFLNIIKGTVKLLINTPDKMVVDVQINIGDTDKPKYIWARITQLATKKLNLKSGDIIYALIKTVLLEKGIEPEP